MEEPGLEPGAQVWDAGLRRGVLTSAPNACPHLLIAIILFLALPSVNFVKC